MPQALDGATQKSKSDLKLCMASMIPSPSLGRLFLGLQASTCKLKKQKVAIQAYAMIGDQLCSQHLWLQLCNCA